MRTMTVIVMFLTERTLATLPSYSSETEMPSPAEEEAAAGAAAAAAAAAGEEEAPAEN